MKGITVIKSTQESGIREKQRDTRVLSYTRSEQIKISNHISNTPHFITRLCIRGEYHGVV